MGRIWSAMLTGIRTGWDVGLRAYLNPAKDTTQFATRKMAYDLYWSYYNNAAFERVSTDLWQAYREQYRLYPYIRSIYNPTRRLVGFYVGSIYPGLVTVDPMMETNGVPIAIPLGEQMPDELRNAIGQVFQWSNWQSAKDRLVKFGAATGDVGIEIVDDMERERVYPIVRWPGHVCDVDRDERGNVERAVIEYEVDERDEAGDMEKYQYRKVMTKESIVTYRNGNPYDFSGLGAEVPNEYGFVPFVWCQHADVGSDHGTPAIDGVLGKIDQLNDLVSRVHKQMGIAAESPQIVASDSPLSSAIDPAAAAELDKNEVKLILLRGKAGTTTASLGGNLDVGQALLYVQELLKEIEHDLPELGMYQELRSMSALTGPAASRLLGDVQAKVCSAASQYDQATKQALQMTVAIAGWRLGRGDWKRKDRQQVNFKGFDLTSYEAGDLDIEIQPRPLVPIVETERWDAEQKRAQALTTYVNAGIPVEVAMPWVGFSEEDVKSITIDSVAAIDRAQRLAQNDLPGNVPPPPQ